MNGKNCTVRNSNCFFRNREYSFYSEIAKQRSMSTNGPKTGAVVTRVIEVKPTRKTPLGRPKLPSDGKICGYQYCHKGRN